MARLYSASGVRSTPHPPRGAGSRPVERARLAHPAGIDRSSFDSPWFAPEASHLPRCRLRRSRSGEFRSLAEIRREIDAIDKRLVPLLAERSVPVRAAAAFKATRAAVRAPRRAARVIANARRLARAHGLDPDLAARIYRAMIAAFIGDEMVEHRRLRAKPAHQRRSR
jgi:isochorismate pyruvate lyase